ncbi:hypothetical protein D3C87_1600880 [compost metagenome]
MDDVLGQVVLAARNEDLAAADCVTAVGPGHGLGANQAQVGAGMRLGQAHGTAPDPGIHVRQILLFQRFAGMGAERQAGTGGQHRVRAERQVGRSHHFLDLGRNGLGHAHATELRIAANADPTAFGEGLVGGAKTVRRLDRAVVPGAALLVAAAVQRCDHFGADLAGLFQDRGSRFFIDHLGQAGQTGP